MLMFLCKLWSRLHCRAKHEESPSLPCGLPHDCHAVRMSLLHCPLCLGLALLSVLRAASHLMLVGLRLSPWRPSISP